jgi:protease II
MKTLIILAATAAMVTSGFAQGDNLTAPSVSRRTVQAQPATPVEGAIQRAARVGNPPQVINPFAPAEYGSGRIFVTNADATGVPVSHLRARPVGLRLFSFAF